MTWQTSGLLLFLGKLVDDFVAADQPKVFACDAFQITTVGFQCSYIKLELLVLVFCIVQARVDPGFVLFQFVNAQ